MNHRKATAEDLPRLLEVRKASILGLATKGMSVSQSIDWASRLTLETLKERLDSAEFWVAYADNEIVGWVSIRGDEITGLYVEPASANRGVGSGLLRLAEGIMLSAGVTTARLDASWNSEEFYLRQGYVATGPRPVDDTRTFTKPLRNSV